MQVAVAGLRVGGALEYGTFEQEPVDWAESTGLQTHWGC